MTGIKLVNNLLANMALRKGCYFVNIAEALNQPDGSQIDEYEADGIHMAAGRLYRLVQLPGNPYGMGSPQHLCRAKIRSISWAADAARAFMQHQQHKYNKCTASPRFAVGQGGAILFYLHRKTAGYFAVLNRFLSSLTRIPANVCQFYTNRPSNLRKF